MIEPARTNRSSSCLSVLVAAMLMATLVAGSFAPLRAENLRMPPHEKIVLKNGLTVLLLREARRPARQYLHDRESRSGRRSCRARRARHSHGRVAAQRNEDAHRAAIFRRPRLHRRHVRRRCDVRLHRRQRRISDERSRHAASNYSPTRCCIRHSPKTKRQSCSRNPPTRFAPRKTIRNRS